MLEVFYPPPNPQSPVLLQGFPLVFTDTWISSHRAAVNRNQWVMQGFTSAEFPSQYPPQQLTWEHTRPIPISGWLCSVTHLQDSPKMNIPTAEDRIGTTKTKSSTLPACSTGLRMLAPSSRRPPPHRSPCQELSKHISSLSIPSAPQEKGLAVDL